MSAPAAKLSPQALEDLAFLRHAPGVHFRGVKQLGPGEWKVALVVRYRLARELPPGLELRDEREEWHLGGSAEEALARARAAAEPTSPAAESAISP